MDTKSRSFFKHPDLSGQIIKVFYEVYNELGFGFLEVVYRNAMVIALQEAGIRAIAESPVHVCFRGHIIGSYRCDILVENTIILELKAVKVLTPEHIAQILHYLRASDIEVGYLLNFAEKPAFKRLIFDNERKHSRGKIQMIADQSF